MRMAGIKAGPLGKQQVSLTAQPSLWPLNRLLDVLCGRQASCDLNMVACVPQGSHVRNLVLHPLRGDGTFKGWSFQGATLGRNGDKPPWKSGLLG